MARKQTQDNPLIEVRKSTQRPPDIPVPWAVQERANEFCEHYGLDTVEKRRAFCKALLNHPRPPSKDWARRILDDPHASDLQLRFAAEALKNERSRIPGEDDE